MTRLGRALVVALALAAAALTAHAGARAAVQDAPPRHALVATAHAGGGATVRGTGDLALERSGVRHVTPARAVAAEVPALAQTEAAELDVVERTLAATGGRADVLERTFRRARSEGAVVVGERRQSIDKTSPLEGHTVRFERSGDGFARRPEPADAEPAAVQLLAGLEPLVDLAPFLPPAPVAIDETWTVAPSAARLLLRPFGALSASEDPWGPLLDGALAGLTGELRGRLVDVTDGRARIDVRGTTRGVAREHEGALAARSVALRMEVRAELVHDVALGTWSTLSGELALTLHRGEDVLLVGGESAREETDLEGAFRLALAREPLAAEAPR